MGAFWILLRSPWVLLIAGAMLVMVYYYNRLVKARLRLSEALSGLDNQLHQRRSLIPRLKQLASELPGRDERLASLLTALSVPEKKLSGEDDFRGRAGEELKLSRQLHRILAELEKNRGEESLHQSVALEEKLLGVENEMLLAARFYNAVVREYNYQIDSFPSGVLAAILNFDRAEFFLLEDAA